MICFVYIKVVNCERIITYATPHWEYLNSSYENNIIQPNINFLDYKRNYAKLSEECAVLSLAFNYTFNEVVHFIFSLRKYYQGDVILFIKEDDYSLYSLYSNKYQINLINITYNSPFYSNNNSIYHFNQSELYDIPKYNYKNYWPTNRWFIFNKWLSKYGYLYKYYLISDVRDVIFQDNPFNWNINEGIYFGEQTRGFEINQNQPNVEFMFYYKYGYKYVNNLLLNAGVIFGTQNTLIDFFQQFSDFLKERYINTIDQAALNYYLYSYGYKHFPAYICENEYGPIRTLHIDFMLSKLNTYPKDDNYVYNRDGSKPVLIHQYDRQIDKYGEFIKYHTNNVE